MTKKTFFYNLIYVLSGVVLIVLLWTVLCTVQGKPLLFPSVGEIVGEMFNLLGSASFYGATSSTLLRCVIAYVTAVVLAFALVLAVSVFPVAGKLIAPFIALLRSFPTMSVILIAMVWLSSVSSPVLVGFLIAFPLLYGNLLGKVNEVSAELTDMCNVYKVSKRRRVIALYIPTMLPETLKQTGTVFPVTLKVVIAGEVLAYTSGSVGLEMFSAKLDVNIALLLAWSIFAVLTGYLIKLAVDIAVKISEKAKCK